MATSEQIDKLREEDDTFFESVCGGTPRIRKLLGQPLNSLTESDWEFIKEAYNDLRTAFLNLKCDTKDYKS